MIDHDNLEEYADPVDYDRQYSSDTGVAFYSALAWEAGGPVLEIACGTGRVAIPIARQGFAVTGLDVVPAMLDRADGGHMSGRWVDLREAAELLGTSTEAVGKRAVGDSKSLRRVRERATTPGRGGC